MQRIVQALKSCNDKLNIEKLSSSTCRISDLKRIASSPLSLIKPQQGFNDGTVAKSLTTMQEKDLPNTTVAEVLMSKGDETLGSWLWCKTDDTVHDAVKQMTKYNIGSLVVLKPGEQQIIAGIFTERGLYYNDYNRSIMLIESAETDYMRKMIAEDRSSKYTKVGDIMTDQEKLITVTSDTNILHAMEQMTENHVRHVPVIDGKIVGLISIGDVVRAVLDQQHREMKKLNDFIHGDYY